MARKMERTNNFCISVKLYPLLRHLARYLMTYVILIISIAFKNRKGELDWSFKELQIVTKQRNSLFKFWLLL